MKTTHHPRLRNSALFTAVAIGALSVLAPQVTRAQSAPQKIQLMAEALRAFDSGSLSLAKKRVDELTELAPDDTNVQGLAARIEQALDEANSQEFQTVQANQVPVEAVPPSEPAAPAEQIVTEPAVEPAAEPAAEPSGAEQQRAGLLRRNQRIATVRSVDSQSQFTAEKKAAARSMVKAAVADQKGQINTAKKAIIEAKTLARHGAYAQANEALDAASAGLMFNVSTESVFEAIEAAKRDIILVQAQQLADDGDVTAAREQLEAYRRAGGSARAANKLSNQLDRFVAAAEQQKADAAAAALAAQEAQKAAAAQAARAAEEAQQAAAAAAAEEAKQAAAAALAAEEAKKAAAARTLLTAAAEKQQAQIAAVNSAIADAKMLAKYGAFAKANGLLNDAAAGLPISASTAAIHASIESAKADFILLEAQELAKAGNPTGARELLQEYRDAGGKAREARNLTRAMDREAANPYALDIEEVSPDFIVQNEIIKELLVRGRTQFLNGDYDGASATFKEVEARDTNNPEAKVFQARIAHILRAIHGQNVHKTRAQMLAEVDQSWERPKVFDIDAGEEDVSIIESGILQKMKAIIVPQVNFAGMELTRVIDTLSELSVEYDPERVGVNIVPLFDANESNPRVNISLRNLNLDRILEFVTQQVNFAYSVGPDAVTVDASDAAGGESSNLTEFFPISRATVIRLTGYDDGSGADSGPVDPFAAPTSGGGGDVPQDEAYKLKQFFQSAGVNFELPGTSLAFAGAELIVTQTSRNLERMRVILRKYNEVEQVEIEAKFLEVTQGDLEEFGFEWTLGHSASALLDPTTGRPLLGPDGQPLQSYNRNLSTINRNLSTTFATGVEESAITIDGQAVASNAPPELCDLVFNA
jgi:hypothetical protein